MVRLQHMVEFENMSDQDYFDQLLQNTIKNDQVMCVGRLLEYAAHEYKDSLALIYNDIQVSYQELYTRACAATRLLREKGVKPRDRVLLYVDNSIEFYIGYYGVVQLGAIIAPLNIFLKDRELVHIIADAQPVAIIASEGSINHLKTMITDSSIILISDLEISHRLPISQQIFQELSCDIYDLDQDELSVLLYTSGTTGLPKGVMLSSKNIMINMIQLASRSRLKQQERVFGVLPLFHSFAQNTCVWSAFFLGHTVIVIPKIDRRYIIAGLRYKPTIFLGVPALYGLLCLLKTADLDSVKYFISGGDALSDKIRAAFALLYRRKIISGYGLTEASPVLSASFDDLSLPTDTVGKPLVNLACELRDEEGNVLPQDHVGRLWVKGGNIMLGYYNDPEKTAREVQDGWLDTGDLATFDASGKLRIVGRLKDLIISKGFNIYPQEIENVIMGHSAVIRVAVIGREEESVGEVPVAYVQLKDIDTEAALTIKKEMIKKEMIEKDLRSLCIKQLAGYKVPKDFIIYKELPVTATGKVDKKALRAQDQLLMNVKK